ncbi:MAG: hypothetical protein K2W95_26875 [Candidatus Obscuribacterales bacterium]|nr:hypothetical protein [Candidatus Obscuribacterales bacterium]
MDLFLTGMLLVFSCIVLLIGAFLFFVHKDELYTNHQGVRLARSEKYDQLRNFCMLRSGSEYLYSNRHFSYPTKIAVTAFILKRIGLILYKQNLLRQAEKVLQLSLSTLRDCLPLRTERSVFREEYQEEAQEMLRQGYQFEVARVMHDLGVVHLAMDKVDEANFYFIGAFQAVEAVQCPATPMELRSGLQLLNSLRNFSPTEPRAVRISARLLQMTADLESLQNRTAGYGCVLWGFSWPVSPIIESATPNQEDLPRLSA